MNVVIDVYGLSDGDDIYNRRYEAIEGMCATRCGENVGISTNPTILTDTGGSDKSQTYRSWGLELPSRGGKESDRQVIVGLRLVL